MSFSYPPSCFDRATGTGGQPGTPTAPGGWLVNGQSSPISFLEELPTSPSIERAEQGTIVHTFRCDQDTARGIILTTGRGVILTDSSGNITRVLSTRYQQEKGNLGLLTITAESVSFDTPPPEFSVDVVEFNPNLTKHPRYSILPRKILWSILKRYESVNPLNGTDWFSQITQGLTGPDIVQPDTAKEAADELTTKLRKGIDSFYLAGFKISFSTYQSIATGTPLINPGGYIEDPVTQTDPVTGQAYLYDPVQGYYFWSRDGTSGGDNVFTFMASQVNPMLYGNGMTYLRLCDSIQFQRTWFRRTQSWIAAPAGGFVNINGHDYNWLGQWDENIYEPVWTGYNTEDFQ